jgi:predicted Zn-dependent protease
MKSLRTLIGSLLIAVMAASAGFASYMPAAVQRPDQQDLKWKGRQIRVSLSNSLTQPSSNIKFDSDVIGAVMRSLRAWEEVADIEFVTDLSEKQGISASGPTGDGVSLITLAQTPENVLLFSKDPDRESAKTRIFYNKGVITEADIVLNPFQQFSTDGTYGTFDLQATLTHEIGHLLGLRHSAVLGATMSESLPKNGTFGLPDLTARLLSRNDIASIRDLYGFKGVDEACCGEITGRLTGVAGRSVKGIVRVWAEETETGRVIAQSEVGADGIYRLGGLPDAAYSVFWQVRDDTGASASGELGSVEIEKGNSVLLNGRITQRLASPSLEYIGINNFLANTAVPVRSGRDYRIYLGGPNLDPKSLGIQFNSSLIRVSSGADSRPDLGEATSVVSFVVSIGQDVPAGLYTIYATGENGVKTSLIGALKVDR